MCGHQCLKFPVLVLSCWIISTNFDCGSSKDEAGKLSLERCRVGGGRDGGSPLRGRNHEQDQAHMGGSFLPMENGFSCEDYFLLGMTMFSSKQQL